MQRAPPLPCARLDVVYAMSKLIAVSRRGSSFNFSMLKYSHGTFMSTVVWRSNRFAYIPFLTHISSFIAAMWAISTSLGFLLKKWAKLSRTSANVGTL